MVSLVRFICNVCNSPCRAETLDREIPSCLKCGSNVRFRWIVHALSTELFGRSVPLKEFPRDRNIRGISLSDWGPIAKILAKRFDYQNTFLHREPRLDVMNPRSGADASCDFIIASEVLEHVPPPVEMAFDNLRRLLKPGGFVVFSSPWESTGDTLEHFPELFDWEIVKFRKDYVLLNRTRDGRLQSFENLVFHNGPGNTVEVRVFSKDGLLANCKAAGFDVAIGEDNPDYGILWEPWSRGMILRKIKTNG
jgi:SAM-dependent methyltransferase